MYVAIFFRVSLAPVVAGGASFLRGERAMMASRRLEVGNARCAPARDTNLGGPRAPSRGSPRRDAAPRRAGGAAAPLPRAWVPGATKSCSSARASFPSSRRIRRDAAKSSPFVSRRRRSSLATDMPNYGIQAIVRSEVMVGRRRGFRPDRRRPSRSCSASSGRLIQRNEAIGYEWLVNCGRRDSTARVAHLLCETAVRMHVDGTRT